MRIDKTYKHAYELTFGRLLENNEMSRFDETALPSCTHSNKLMSYLFWKRIEIAFCMAGIIDQSSILDFGCGGGGMFKYFQARDYVITNTIR